MEAEKLGVIEGEMNPENCLKKIGKRDKEEGCALSVETLGVGSMCVP